MKYENIMVISYNTFLNYKSTHMKYENTYVYRTLKLYNQT